MFDFVLFNYHVIDRRERHLVSNRGRVISYVRDDLNNISDYMSGSSAERIWHLMQRDTAILPFIIVYRYNIASSSFKIVWHLLGHFYGKFMEIICLKAP